VIDTVRVNPRLIYSSTGIPNNQLIIKVILLPCVAKGRMWPVYKLPAQLDLGCVRGEAPI
jgi:hypothetical protein